MGRCRCMIYTAVRQRLAAAVTVIPSPSLCCSHVENTSFPLLSNPGGNPSTPGGIVFFSFFFCRKTIPLKGNQRMHASRLKR